MATIKLLRKFTALSPTITDNNQDICGLLNLKQSKNIVAAT